MQNIRNIRPWDDIRCCCSVELLLLTSYRFWTPIICVYGRKKTDCMPLSLSILLTDVEYVTVITSIVSSVRLHPSLSFPVITELLVAMHKHIVRMVSLFSIQRMLKLNRRAQAHSKLMARNCSEGIYTHLESWKVNFYSLCSSRLSTHCCCRFYSLPFVSAFGKGF